MGATEAVAVGVAVGIGLGFWGWAIIIVEFVLLFAFAEYERGVYGLVSMAVLAALLYFVSGVNFFEIVSRHPWFSGLFAVLYFPIGATWSVWRYKRFSTKRAGEYKEALAYFIKSRIADLSNSSNGNQYVENILEKKGKIDTSKAVRVQIPEIEKTKNDWLEMFKNGILPDAFLNDWKSRSYQTTIPTWSENKDRLTAWVMLWPWSAIWYFIADFITELCEEIVSRLKGMYNSIAKNAYKDIDPRLLKEEND